MTDVTLVPLIPDLSAPGEKYLLRDHSDEFRAAYIRISPERGRLLLHAEHVPGKEVDLPLADVAGLVRVSWTVSNGSSGPVRCAKVLVIGHDGHTLAATRRQFVPVFDKLWTRSILEPSGLLLPDEDFRTSGKLQKAHPGASPAWFLVTPPYNFLLIFLAILAVLAVIFAFTQ